MSTTTMRYQDLMIAVGRQADACNECTCLADTNCTDTTNCPVDTADNVLDTRGTEVDRMFNDVARRLQAFGSLVPE